MAAVELGATGKTGLQPAQFCAYLLEAMGESEARRKRRKRDTGPDVIGMGIKRDLLRRAVDEDPPADEFEEWLVHQVLVADAAGPVRAMAIEILADFENARAFDSFNQWLAEGAPTPRVKDPARPRKRA